MTYQARMFVAAETIQPNNPPDDLNSPTNGWALFSQSAIMGPRGFRGYQGTSVVPVYIRSDSEPDAPTGSWDGNTLTLMGGWQTDIPSGTETVWRVDALLNHVTTTVSFNAVERSTGPRGHAGVSPTVAVVANGVRIIDGAGNSVTVTNGEDGTSPTVATLPNGVRITDAAGNSVTLMDGEDGDDGVSPTIEAVANGVRITDAAGNTVTLLNGANGVSPTVEQLSNGVRITDAAGTEAVLTNGTDGTGIVIDYSENGVDWHTAKTTDDIWRAVYREGEERPTIPERIKPPTLAEMVQYTQDFNDIRSDFFEDAVAFRFLFRVPDRPQDSFVWGPWLRYSNGNGSGGITEAEVLNLIADWAERQSSENIPDEKISNDIARTSSVTALANRVSAIENQPDPTSGLTQAQVDRRVDFARSNYLKVDGTFNTGTNELTATFTSSLDKIYDTNGVLATLSSIRVDNNNLWTPTFTNEESATLNWENYQFIIIQGDNSISGIAAANGTFTAGTFADLQAGDMRVIILPPDSTLTDGTAFPTAGLRDGVYHLFTEAVASGLTWQDGDGNALTSAAAGDFARYNGTNWVRIFTFSTAGNNDDFPAAIADASTTEVKSEASIKRYVDAEIESITEGQESPLNAHFDITFVTSAGGVAAVPSDESFTDDDGVEWEFAAVIISAVGNIHITIDEDVVNSPTPALEGRTIILTQGSNRHEHEIASGDIVRVTSARFQINLGQNLNFVAGTAEVDLIAHATPAVIDARINTAILAEAAIRQTADAAQDTRLNRIEPNTGDYLTVALEFQSETINSESVYQALNPPNAAIDNENGARRTITSVIIYREDPVRVEIRFSEAPTGLEGYTFKIVQGTTVEETDTPTVQGNNLIWTSEDNNASAFSAAAARLVVSKETQADNTDIPDSDPSPTAIKSERAIKAYVDSEVSEIEGQLVTRILRYDEDSLAILRDLDETRTNTYPFNFDAETRRRRDELDTDMVVRVHFRFRVQAGLGAADSRVRAELLTETSTVIDTQEIDLDEDGTDNTAILEGLITSGNVFRVRSTWLSGSDVDEREILAAYGAEIDAGLISYLKSQDLTNSQKQQARDNIDAVAESDVADTQATREIHFRGTFVAGTAGARITSGVLPDEDGYYVIDNNGLRRRISQVAQRQAGDLRVQIVHDAPMDIRGRHIIIRSGSHIFSMRVPLNATTTGTQTLFAYSQEIPLGDFEFVLSDDQEQDVEGRVRYDAPQTLTDAQQEQARDNIEASPLVFYPLEDNESLPAPTADNENRIYFRRRTGAIYAQIHIPRAHTDRSVTFEDYPLVTGSTAGIIGGGDVLPLFNGHTGQYFYHTGEQRWETWGQQDQFTSGWVFTTPETVFGNSTTWEGQYRSTSQANAAVNAVGDVVWIGRPHDGRLRRVTAFTAGTDVPDSRTWGLIGSAGELTGLTQDEVDARVRSLIEPSRAVAFEASFSTGTSPISFDSGTLPDDNLHRFVDNAGRERRITRVTQSNTNQIVVSYTPSITTLIDRQIVIRQGSTIFQRRIVASEVGGSSMTFPFTSAFSTGMFSLSISDDAQDVGVPVANQITMDTPDGTGNLATTDTDLQDLANAFDDADLGGGSSSQVTGLSYPLVMNGRVNVTHSNVWAANQNTPDATIPTGDEWGFVQFDRVSNARSGFRRFRWQDLRDVSSANYEAATTEADRLQFISDEQNFFLGRTSSNEILVTMDTTSDNQEPNPIVIYTEHLDSPLDRSTDSAEIWATTNILDTDDGSATQYEPITAVRWSVTSAAPDGVETHSTDAHALQLPRLIDERYLLFAESVVAGVVKDSALLDTGGGETDVQEGAFTELRFDDESDSNEFYRAVAFFGRTKRIDIQRHSLGGTLPANSSIRIVGVPSGLSVGTSSGTQHFYSYDHQTWERGVGSATNNEERFRVQTGNGSERWSRGAGQRSGKHIVSGSGWEIYKLALQVFPLGDGYRFPTSVSTVNFPAGAAVQLFNDNTAISGTEVVLNDAEITSYEQTHAQGRPVRVAEVDLDTPIPLTAGWQLHPKITGPAATVDAPGVSANFNVFMRRRQTVNLPASSSGGTGGQVSQVGHAIAIYYQRSATKPSAPSGVTFDGLTFSGGSPWTLTVPSGTAQLWVATANIQLLSNAWVFGDWHIQADNQYNFDYARLVDNSDWSAASWHFPYQANDTHRRRRDENGNYIYEALDAGLNAWRLLNYSNKTWNADSDTTINLATGVSFEVPRKFRFTWRNIGGNVDWRNIVVWEPHSNWLTGLLRANDSSTYAFSNVVTIEFRQYGVSDIGQNVFLPNQQNSNVQASFQFYFNRASGLTDPTAAGYNDLRQIIVKTRPATTTGGGNVEGALTIHVQ